MLFMFFIYFSGTLKAQMNSTWSSKFLAGPMQKWKSIWRKNLIQSSRMLKKANHDSWLTAFHTKATFGTMEPCHKPGKIQNIPTPILIAKEMVTLLTSVTLVPKSIKVVPLLKWKSWELLQWLMKVRVITVVEFISLWNEEVGNNAFKPKHRLWNLWCLKCYKA